MPELFSHESSPLAERMRPKNLDEIIGQEHLTGNEAVLKKAVLSGRIPSIIFWGPPGSGKTTLAQVIANETQKPFFSINAVSSGVKDVREIIDQAKVSSKQPLVFIDEIHRFNKSQQDALLQAVEKGYFTLIGATTENPSFEVNAALISRCQVYVLKPLSAEHLTHLLQHAITTDENLKGKQIEILETEALFQLSGGDARRLLNLLELIADQSRVVSITNELVQSLAQQKTAIYDKKGDMHYDVISAFIKSIRGSDPNAALYYLARMIQAGEDVKFIARRMVILASEDIGNANPTALVMATTTFQAVAMIGYPEARILLSQCVIYLATSAKSNSSYEAIEKALHLVKSTGDLPIPLALRNAPTKLMKDMLYGADYQYSHLGENNFIEQEFLPSSISGTRLYDPGNNVREHEFLDRLRSLWKKKYGY